MDDEDITIPGYDIPEVVVPGKNLGWHYLLLIGGVAIVAILLGKNK